MQLRDTSDTGMRQFLGQFGMAHEIRPEPTLCLSATERALLRRTAVLLDTIRERVLALADPAVGFPEDQIGDSETGRDLSFAESLCSELAESGRVKIRDLVEPIENINP